MYQLLEEKKRTKFMTDEKQAWEKIERLHATYFRNNKPFTLFVEEATDRKNIAKHEEKMRTLLTFYTQKFVENNMYVDMYFDFDFEDICDELNKPPRCFDIWDIFIDMVYCMFNIELEIEKYKLDKRIATLKSDLDNHYGITPETDSSASLCKIMEFGYERAEELKLFYEWKDAEMQKIKDTIEAINLFYREAKY